MLDKSAKMRVGIGLAARFMPQAQREVVPMQLPGSPRYFVKGFMEHLFKFSSADRGQESLWSIVDGSAVSAVATAIFSPSDFSISAFSALTIANSCSSFSPCLSALLNRPSTVLSLFPYLLITERAS